MKKIVASSLFALLGLTSCYVTSTGSRSRIQELSESNSHIVVYPLGTVSNYEYSGNCWKVQENEPGYYVIQCKSSSPWPPTGCKVVLDLADGTQATYEWECGSSVKLVEITEPMTGELIIYIIYE